MGAAGRDVSKSEATGCHQVSINMLITTRIHLQIVA